MRNNFFVILCFLVSLKVCAENEKILLAVEGKDFGVLVYVINTTSNAVNIKNTLNLRGKGSSLSPISLLVRDESETPYSQVMVVDSVDEVNCLRLRPNAIHGTVYKHEYIKKMFHLDPGIYYVKATYNDVLCEKENSESIKDVESEWIKIKI